MPEENNAPSPETPGRTRSVRPWGPNAWLLILVLATMAIVLLTTQRTPRAVIDYSFFKEQLQAGNVDSVRFHGRQGQGRFVAPPEAPPTLNAAGELVPPRESGDKPALLPQDFSVTIPDWASEVDRGELTALLDKHTHWAYQEATDNSALFLGLMSIALPILLLVFLWIMFRRTRDQLMGGGFLSGFTKSPAKRYEVTKEPTTFKDVAGLEGVKEDLQELVDFLSNPQKFRRLGGRVPKGILLNGPPGTGKTMLARAVAGEAGVPFFTVSGSEFIQMFVGVGASRVRDLFQTAKQHAPAIIFIDEIDAVGRQRGAGLGGGHDEREQTLNQILSEMDGFTPNDSVIVLAATNRPDVLDPALLRPGRFDRHITVDRPTLRGRVAIFRVHVRDVPLADDVDLDRLAAGTVGLTGADIRNLVNEAALWATRSGKDRVYMDDFEHARDKILMGPKREELLLGDEKRKTAYHEAGHALLAWLTPSADRVHKVTVIPRGRALGVTQMLPEEDRMNITQRELEDRLMFLLGGRAAETIVFEQLSAGAENDLERATMLARRMVTKWGMSERLGPVSYKLSDDDPFLGREMHQQRQFSEHTLQRIDEEIARVLHESAERAERVLRKHRDKLDLLADALVEREELSETEITELIGPAVREDRNGQPLAKADQLTTQDAAGRNAP